MMYSLLFAALTVGSPFSDGCVLQRDRPVPVWGVADPGADVTVTFAGCGKKTTAGEDGRWRVDIGPFPASALARELKVSGSGRELSVKDVLVGEVWLASGQSNMAFSFLSGNPRDRERNAGLVAELLRKPTVRMAKVPYAKRSDARKNVRWFPAVRESLVSQQCRISAVALYFALALEDVLDVPVGVLDVSVGASAIDSWIPDREYEGFVPPSPGPSRYPPQVFFDGMVAPLAPFACRGLIWYQGESNAKKGEWFRYSAKMKAMMAGWRRVFENPGLSLRMAAIAPCWNPLVPYFNLQQFQFAEDDPLASAVVTADVANLYDVHPNDKETVARRLAAHALKYDYAFDIKADSPVVTGWRAEGSKARLFTANAETLFLYHPDWMYRSDAGRTEELGFELAGADGVWKPARILNLEKTVTGEDRLTKRQTSEFRGQISGKELVLEASGVESPVSVRYLFRKPWRAALYNEASLPMGPFLFRLPTEGVVEFPKGEYRFAAEESVNRLYYISNHDHVPSRAVVFPIAGATNLTVKGNGSRFVIDGEAIAFSIRDSENVRVEGIDLDWTRPSCREAVITSIADGETRFRMVDPYREQGECMIRLFRGDTREMLPGASEVRLKGDAEDLGGGIRRLRYDFSKVGAGARVGDILAFRKRNPDRPCPAVFVENAENTVFEDFTVRTADGMALLAQLSGDIRWSGGGVFPREGRYASTQADATHFSNVRGKVIVENCRFEGMMDDAINVHSTCLAIDEILHPGKIRCRFAHAQAFGFELVRSGETLRFLDAETLDAVGEVKVRRVLRESDRILFVELEGGVPPGIRAGDVVENADRQCAVTFRNNRVLRNRARGAIFTTPHPVLVESNVFDRVTGAALLFSGDASTWYESGACRDVVIRGNVFRNCMFAVPSHSISKAVITFIPVVRRHDAVKKRYHGGITVSGNVFDMFPAPLLYVSGVSGLDFSDNVLSRNADYPPHPDGRTFIVGDSDGVVVSGTDGWSAPADSSYRSNKKEKK